jgi:hypothetical protein
MSRTLKSGMTLGAVALIAASSPGAADFQKVGDIVGRWKGEFAGDGTKTSVIIDFFPRGTYARRVDVINEFGWTLNGDALMLAPAVSRSNNEVSYGKPAVLKMRLADDMLVISDSAQSISLKRVTVPINESAILGRWEGQSDLNEGITQDFLSDGRLIITVTLAREAGRFSLDGRNITFEEQIPTPRKKKSRYKIEDGKLVLYQTPDVPGMEMTRVAEMSRH